MKKANQSFQEFLLKPKKVDEKKTFFQKYKEKKINKSQAILIFFLLFSFVLSTYLMYQTTLPKTYAFSLGDMSSEDIYLSRPIVNYLETEKKAKEAAEQVADVYLVDSALVQKNFEKILDFSYALMKVREEIFLELQKNVEGSTESTENSVPILQREMFSSIEDARSFIEKNTLEDAKWTLKEIELDVFIQSLREKSKREQVYLLTEEEATYLLEAPPSVIAEFLRKLFSFVEELQQESLDFTQLQLRLLQLKNQQQSQTEAPYKNVFQQMYNLLQKTQSVNLSFNFKKTKLAKEQAYKEALTQYVYYEKNTRIVEKGEVLNEKKMELLSLAGLLQTNHLDYATLLGTLLYLSLLYVMGILYVTKASLSLIKTSKDQLVTLLLLLFVFVLSALFFKQSLPHYPVLFVSILLAYYFSARDSLVYSLLLVMALFPLTGFSYLYLFVALASVLASSLCVKALSGRDHYALIIFVSTLVPPLAFSVLAFMLKMNVEDIFLQVLIYALVGLLSSIAAIGTMPLLEIFLDALSPLRLLVLSNQNQELLIRMRQEAKGTYHHSMMVATLAEVAAEKIGADALLVRVGAFYHDIGKLESPLMFTENQEGENPHDKLEPEMSAKIILGHVTKGLSMAESIRLPKRLQDFIAEHHGTQHLSMFYQKACEQAQKEGKALPDKALFTYVGPSPRSKETAVLMMADSIEAAMKSTGYKDLENAEKLMRNIVKSKFEQQQFLHSQLSFSEVEACIQAFLNVYAGQFQERVKY